MPPLSRRAFLRAAGGTAAGIAVLAVTGCEENSVTPRVTGTAIPFLTPTADFFVQYGADGAVPGWSAPPAIDDASWSLQIDGAVASPLSLRYDDVLAAPRVRVLKTIRCIIDSNEVPGLIGTALWEGTPLRPFLDAAGIDRNAARRLRIHGADGFTNNLRIPDVYRSLQEGAFEPLLVTHMNGAPLTREHGAPVRLLVFDGYGFKNVKWISRIEATASDDVFGTYQEVYGYVDDGAIRPVSKITAPLFNAIVPAGAVQVTGIAVSGLGAVSRVELAVDDGPWEEATIIPLAQSIVESPEIRSALQAETAAFPFPGVWVTWTYRWNAVAGTHTLRVRTRDSEGNGQTDEDPTFEDGYTPVARIEVRAA